ncbi:hypothetical protein OQA88_13497 [Cercophora sp. LCS_1]
MRQLAGGTIVLHEIIVLKLEVLYRVHLSVSRLGTFNTPSYYDTSIVEQQAQADKHVLDTKRALFDSGSYGRPRVRKLNIHNREYFSVEYLITFTIGENGMCVLFIDHHNPAEDNQLTPWFDLEPVKYRSPSLLPVVHHRAYRQHNGSQEEYKLEAGVRHVRGDSFFPANHAGFLSPSDTFDLLHGIISAALASWAQILNMLERCNGSLETTSPRPDCSPVPYPDGVKPFMALSSEGRSDIVKDVSQFSQADDVFCSIFLTDTVGVLGAPKDVQSRELQGIETKIGTWTVKSVYAVTSLQGGKASIPPGPYFLRGNAIHQAWKLYPDTLDAFSIAAYAEGVGSEKNVTYAFPSLEPERKPAPPCISWIGREKPLAGKRIAIKDNYRLSGVKSTFSSRPYEATYGPDKDTAIFVQRLIKLGAIIVGKSKMSAFASAEEPTDQWVDFHTPFNPRGDGYQTPAESSNGAAAALSGYDWLDFAFATDTFDIRLPFAASLGFDIHDTQSQQGGLPPVAGEEFDSIGLLGRDLETFHELVALTVEGGAGDVTKACRPTLKERPVVPSCLTVDPLLQYPKRILYPTDFLPYTEEPVQAILEEFTVQLERYLGTGFYPFNYDGYNVNKQFLEDHRNKFGKEVYFGPYMRWKMETGSKVTLGQKEQGLREGAVYRSRFAEHVLRKDKDTASDAILVILRMPQLVPPVGQVPYESTASGRQEYHPITASLVGAEGGDLMLVNLARETCAHAGWGEKVLTGRFTWKLGDGVRNVDDAGTKSAIQAEGHYEL